MKVLFTNDDGIQAPGIRALQENLPAGVEALVCAPATEKSASSHAISLGQSLRVEKGELDGIPQYAVHGTPADCVKWALSELRDFLPDLVVSGINQGANTGVSVYYSGTISAAREGVINRIPAIAVSLCSRTFRDYRASLAITHRLIEGFRSGMIPSGTLLNVNLPPLAPDGIRGVKVTKQASSRFVEEFVTEKQQDGKTIYKLAGEIELYDEDGTSDEEAVLSGFISLTPLRLDMTNYDAVPVFEAWLKKQ